MISNILIRTFIFFVIALLLMQGFFPIALVAVFLVGVFVNAYEYIFLAFFIDCYFSAEPITFWYTLVVFTLVFGSILIRPFIRVANDTIA